MDLNKLPKDRNIRDSRKVKRSKKQIIELSVSVKSNKIIIQAPPMYASQNIIVFANDEPIFTGSLSRKSEMNLSLSNKEGKKLLKEIDREKDIYGKIK
ncbi:MAG: hypothetical protein ACFE8P_08025 [Promethearchaeota archaeon]